MGKLCLVEISARRGMNPTNLSVRGSENWQLQISVRSLKKRRANILRQSIQEGYDVIVAFEPQNIFYLTGFWGEAIAVCASNGTKLIAPRLEYRRAEKTSEDCEVIPTERGSELISTFVSQIKNRKACTDCSDYPTVESVRKQGGDMHVDTAPFFNTRKIKDESEIKVMAKASRILDRLYEICEKEIKDRLSEREIQAKLIYEGMRMDANPPSYKSTLNPLIIAGGPNGALPHAEVTDRKFRKGDMIVVDLTLRHEGYIADATRTFVLGSPSSEMKKVYSIVQESQRAGLDAAKSGTTCGTVDAVCRERITQGGYEDLFIHSTGHGIGLDVHEPPWLRMNSSEVLQPNVAVTVEPGIYVENKFGVRIEDSIIVTDRRPRVLNRFTKDLVELG